MKEYTASTATVTAFQIKAIESSDTGLRLIPADDNEPPLKVVQQWLSQRDVRPGGYYVVIDGGVTYCPEELFALLFRT